jgi:hypothetical protein
LVVCDNPAPAVVTTVKRFYRTAPDSAMAAPHKTKMIQPRFHRPRTSWAYTEEVRIMHPLFQSAYDRLDAVGMGAGLFPVEKQESNRTELRHRLGEKLVD